MLNCVILSNRKVFEEIQPDLAALTKAYLKQDRIGGVIITLKGRPENGAVDHSGKPYDFISRYFDPWNGVPEDPVTGKYSS